MPRPHIYKLNISYVLMHDDPTVKVSKCEYYRERSAHISLSASKE